MDSDPRKVEKRPPALIDRAVRHLIPPACREHVIGDLWERYSSPGQYVADALRALPFVIASQIRRNVNVPLLVIVAFVLATLFGGPGFLASAITDPSNLIPSGIATIAALCGFVLRDAYRSGDGPSVRHAAVDILSAGAFVLLSQGMLALTNPALLVGGQWLSARAIILFFALVVIRRTRGEHFPMVPVGGKMSMGELTHEVRKFEQRLRLGSWIGFIVAFVVIVVIGISLWRAKTLLAQVGCGVIIASSLFMAYSVTKNGLARPMEIERGFAPTLLSFRNELERRVRLMRGAWWSYLLPMLIGASMVAFGGSTGLTQPQDVPRIAGVIGGTLFLCTLAAILSLRGARKMQSITDRLAAIEEER